MESRKSFSGITVKYKFKNVCNTFIKRDREVYRRITKTTIWFLKIIAYFYFSLIRQKLKKHDQKFFEFYVPTEVIFNGGFNKYKLHRLKKAYKNFCRISKKGKFLRVLFSVKFASSLEVSEKEKFYYPYLDGKVHIPRDLLMKAETIEELIFAFYAGTVNMSEVCYIDKLTKDFKILFDTKYGRQRKHKIVKKLNSLYKKFGYILVFVSSKEHEKMKNHNFKSMEQKLVETNIILQ